MGDFYCRLTLIQLFRDFTVVGVARDANLVATGRSALFVVMRLRGNGWFLVILGSDFITRFSYLDPFDGLDDERMDEESDDGGFVYGVFFVFSEGFAYVGEDGHQEMRVREKEFFRYGCF